MKSIQRADCGHKLNQKILHNSRSGNKNYSRENKAEVMAKDVLAPMAELEMFLKLSKPFPISIQTACIK